MATAIPLPDERDRKLKGVVKPDDKPANDEALDVEEQADGSVIINDPGKKKPVQQGDFYANLAEVLDENELNTLARDLLDRIEQDKESRRKRDEQYAEGLRRTGLDGDAPGGAQFAGASRASHPMIAEAAIDFSASAMRELFPPNGPVRTNITGTQTPEKIALAERQFKYLNWYMTNKMEEYPEELAQTTTQLPMGGSQFMKFWGEEAERRVKSEFVPVDDLLLPYGAVSFWSSPRITHVQRLSDATWEERVDSQMYRDVDEAAPGDTPETSKAGEVSERIEGVDQPAENLEGIRLVYESNTFLKISADHNKRLPYLISVCERTGKVAALYRNWEEEDPKKKRLHWIADFGFIPWRGAYKLGISQLIGGLSAAATGALRALLDSALVNTIPVLAKMKGVKFGSQTKNAEAMSAVEVEAGTTIDDIRKAMMALPFNPPSPVLFELLGWLSDTAKGVVTTAEEKISEANSQMPVGTTLALIEQGAKVFSSIHAGLHRSQKKCIQIIARILKDYIDEQEQIEEFGEIIATPEDFKKALGVIPVSDPNIFSEGQRYAQMQLVQANLAAFPQLHNAYEVLHSSYKLAKIPNIDSILPPPKTPTELNAAAENSAVMLGTPIMAFPEQDHVAHLETHMRFIMDPLFGASPAVVPQSFPRMIEHVKQHMAMLYAKAMHDVATAALGQDLGEAMKDKRLWPKIDKLLAAASRSVHDQLTKMLAPLGPEIVKIVQQIEKMKPPPPMDPSQAALQVAQMDDKRETQANRDKTALAAQDLERKREKDYNDAVAKARDADIKASEAVAKHGREGAKLELDAAQRAHDAVLALQAQGHGQAMDIAGHQQDINEHAAGLDQQERDRQQQNAHHAAGRDDALAGREQEQAQFEATQHADREKAEREEEVRRQQQQQPDGGQQ